jgi:signal transduction histidine kinase
MLLLYWYRLHQRERQHSMRFEERVCERERIARELHDTLLQGFHGLMLRFQVATQEIPRSERSRQVMEDALDRADKLLADSRSRIHGLRHETMADTPLSDAFAFMAGEIQSESDIACRVTLAGNSRILHPAIKDEVFLIGREAIVNAFMHAQCLHVDIELNYGSSAFCLRIKDDGKGIPQEVLRSGGRPGHWGICGMRERARKLGGVLTVFSASGSGTDVKLILPARVAYDESTRARFWGNLRAFFTPSQAD